jgi:hypothetical protein
MEYESDVPAGERPGMIAHPLLDPPGLDFLLKQITALDEVDGAEITVQRGASATVQISAGTGSCGGSRLSFPIHSQGHHVGTLEVFAATAVGVSSELRSTLDRIAIMVGEIVSEPGHLLNCSAADLAREDRSNSFASTSKSASKTAILFALELAIMASYVCVHLLRRSWQTAADQGRVRNRSASIDRMRRG